MSYSHNQELEETIQTGLTAFELSGLVVISGPAGAGKSHLARWIHNRVKPDEPFLDIAAASLESNRLESVLFGHVKGAFTGAVNAYTGLVGAVGQGSLCIEGLENLSHESQAKLLRFVQQRHFRPVGSQSERVFDGGIVFTASLPPRALFASQILRDDFYFRIHGNQISLPGCEGRLADFPAIGEIMLSALAEILPLGKLPGIRDLEILAEHAVGGLDGNFHGVWNLLQQAAILGQPIQALLTRDSIKAGVEQSAFTGGLPETGSLKGDLAQVEKQLILRALDKYQGSRQDLADALGISIRSLMYKLKEYDLS